MKGCDWTYSLLQPVSGGCTVTDGGRIRGSCKHVRGDRYRHTGLDWESSGSHQCRCVTTPMSGGIDDESGKFRFRCVQAHLNAQVAPFGRPVLVFCHPLEDQSEAGSSTLGQ
jgi:hypothetical protein